MGEDIYSLNDIPRKFFFCALLLFPDWNVGTYTLDFLMSPRLESNYSSFQPSQQIGARANSEFLAELSFIHEVPSSSSKGLNLPSSHIDLGQNK